jgi:hypothetical protein
MKVQTEIMNSGNGDVAPRSILGLKAKGSTIGRVGTGTKPKGIQLALHPYGIHIDIRAITDPQLIHFLTKILPSTACL